MMGNFTRAIVLSETDINTIANEILDEFIEEYLDEYYDEETNKVVIEKDEIKDIYNDFKSLVESKYEFLLYNEEADTIVAYINEKCREINTKTDFRWVIEEILEIEKPEDLIKIIRDISDHEIEIK